MMMRFDCLQIFFEKFIEIQFVPIILMQNVLHTSDIARLNIPHKLYQCVFAVCYAIAD